MALHEVTHSAPFPSGRHEVTVVGAVDGLGGRHGAVAESRADARDEHGRLRGAGLFAGIAAGR